MSKVEANSTFGNFKWFGHAEVTDAQAVVLANLGFLWIMQRSPSSNAEKTLAGYEKRPAKFERKSIDFTQANADKLAALLGAKAEIAKNDSITPVIDKVEFHEIGAGAEPVYRDEKLIVQRHIDAKDIVTWASDVVGFTGEGDLNPENVEFLKAVKAYKVRRLQEV
jgi:hypothetical protein